MSEDGRSDSVLLSVVAINAPLVEMSSTKTKDMAYHLTPRCLAVRMSDLQTQDYL